MLIMPRQGPAHCRTPLWAHPQIWPHFQVYAGCAPLAPPPTEDFVPYNFLNLAVPPGSCSRLSSKTSATLPWEFRVVALSAQQSRVFFSSYLPTLQLCRIAPSQLLVPRFGMGYLWRSDCSLGLSLTPFTLI